MFKLLLLALLPLTLGWKLAVRPHDTGQLSDKGAQLKVADFPCPAAFKGVPVR